jgi:hypothetical protein
LKINSSLNEEMTTTGGDRSLVSVEDSQSPIPKHKKNVIDVIGQGFILCQVTLHTPKGTLEFVIREFDFPNVAKIADQIYLLGGFTDHEMRESLQFYLQNKINKA